MQSVRERLTIRAAVFLGFAMIFALWLFGWMQLSQRVRQEQTRAAVLNARYVKAQGTLANIRTQVLMASVTFRDALLDPVASNMGRHRSQLEKIYDSLDVLMAQYEPVSDNPVELEEFARLRRELENFRDARLAPLFSDRQEWEGEIRTLLSQSMRPQRDSVIAISERIQALNSAGYQRQQADIAEGYESVERETWQALGLSFVIGVAVAFLAAAYATRLERRLRQQMALDAELAHDLQDLSARLVTVQEQERRHIARELHDEIGQALTAIKVELSCAQTEIERHHAPSSVLDPVRSITDAAIQEVRDLSQLLHPAVLDELGLLSAVEAQVKAFGKRHGVRAVLTHADVDCRLPRTIETAAYRIVQEALTNIGKHANATECHVRLAVEDETLQISVSDNGVGFDTAVVRTRHRRGLGLIGMRERASHLHGHIRVESDAGRGTRLIVDLPVGTGGEPAMSAAELNVNIGAS